MTKGQGVTVQCVVGHVYTSYTARDKAKAENRAKKGFLDAPILSAKECDDCIEELRRRNASYAMYDMELD